MILQNFQRVLALKMRQSIVTWNILIVKESNFYCFICLSTVCKTHEWYKNLNFATLNNNYGF